MSREQEHPSKLPLKGIYINVRERAIEFEDDHGTVARIVFTGETVLVEGQPLTLVPSAEPQPATAALREQEPTVTLAGTLLTAPRAGKPDRRGNPTAWARFAAAEAGQDAARVYGATFYRATVPIALSLAEGSPLTVAGYARTRVEASSKRVDTLAVVHLVSYPGKPDAQPSRSPRGR